MNLNAWYWSFLENYVYRIKEPPARLRTKPMEVLCVGLPRSGTESLQQALLKLDYDYTYHGWDILFETPPRMPAWVRLDRRKFYPTPDTPTGPISASEFDKVIGNAVALTDAAGSCFASDLIQAYPEAKVVLNVRSDLDAWHRSAITNLVGVNERWGVWLMSWLGAELFWMWHVYERILWYALFQCTDGTLRSGVEGKGKRIHKEHCDMVRGLMSRLGREEDLLEWQVEDGWEPLCRFLGKEVPDGPFPRINDREGFKSREDAILKRTTAKAVKNGLLLSGFFVGLVVVAWRLMRQWS